MNIINNVATLEFNTDERKLLHETSMMLAKICQDVENDDADWDSFSMRGLKRLSEIFQEASESGRAYLY